MLADRRYRKRTLPNKKRDRVPAVEEFFEGDHGC